MPTAFETLTLADAKRLLNAGEAKADEFAIPYNIAVVDAGGQLLSFTRQDGAMTGCVDLAINKAYSTCAFDKPTHVLGELAQPVAELFGIQHSNAGKVVIFGGGIPIRRNGVVIGAIGASGGTVAQDIAVATTALRALEPSIVEIPATLANRS
jgi:uncharacterized protein GlcG (DUF336 family)